MAPSLSKLSQALIIFAVGHIVLASRSSADTFPDHTVNLVVPYTAGGPTDQIARIIGDYMGHALETSFVIDNVSGAGGNIAADKVAKAAPDGYTLLIHHLALLAAPSLYPGLRYDPRELQPVGLVNSGPLVLVVRKDLPVNSAAELWTYIKAHGDRVTAGHAGAGTNSHLCEAMLAQALGVKLTYVAYKGAAQALNDIIAGHIDLLCDQSTNSVPQILAGNAKAIAVTSPERNASIPHVPTMAEVGMPQVVFTVWHGVYAPKGTPAAIVQKLNGALAAAQDDPEVKSKFAAVGTEPYPRDQRTVGAHKALFDADFARISTLIETAGIKLGEAK
jgi:putative tricarboxylic transport membrane protein